MNALDILQEHLRRELRIKQRMLEQATEIDDKPAIRRIEKSIVLRTTKLLCEHKVRTHNTNVQGKPMVLVRCDICRTTASWP